MSDGPQPSEEDGSGSPPAALSARRPASPPTRPHLWRKTFSSLSNRNYLFLWLGIMAWMGGMQMQMLARAYLVYDLTGSASLLGMVNAASAVPMLALPLFGGVIADRFQRVRIVQMGQAASMVLAAVIGVAIATDQVAWYHLMIAAAAQGTLFSFAMPARQALIAQLVPRGQLTNALALNAGAMSAMTLAAPAVGGLMYALLGPAEVYYLIAALSGAAILVTGFIRAAPGRTAVSRGAMLADIAAGLNYTRRDPLITLLLLVTLFTTLLTMPFQFLMPVFVVDVYQRGPDAMGLLIAITGGGSLVGSLMIAAVGSWKRGLMLLAGSLISGVALMLVAAVPFYYAAAGFMVLLGLGNAGRRTLVQSMVMEAAEEHYRGRVISLYMMNFGLIQLGILPIGILMDVWGGRMTLGIMAVLLLVGTTFVLATQRRLREAN